MCRLKNGYGWWGVLIKRLMGQKMAPTSFIKSTVGDKQFDTAHHRAHKAQSLILQWKFKQEWSHTHLWHILKLQMKQKTQTKRLRYLYRLRFHIDFDKRKRKHEDQNGPICNNRSVARLKTHLCCATEFYVLIGLLSDAELSSLCQSEPVEPAVYSSCRHLRAWLLSGLHLIYI